MSNVRFETGFTVDCKSSSCSLPRCQVASTLYFPCQHNAHVVRLLCRHQHFTAPKLISSIPHVSPALGLFDRASITYSCVQSESLEADSYFPPSLLDPICILRSYRRSLQLVSQSRPLPHLPCLDKLCPFRLGCVSVAFQLAYRHLPLRQIIFRLLLRITLRRCLSKSIR